jgi:hypothetical protein
MNGRVAKKLRRIARQLNLNPVASYVPGGRLRRRPDRWDSNEKGERVLIQGAPIQRPGVLVECFRRAYREAKKIYKGQPPSVCVPESGGQEEAPFHARVVTSMQKYYNNA